MRKFQLIFLWMLVITLCGCGKKEAPVQPANEISEPVEAQSAEVPNAEEQNVEPQSEEPQGTEHQNEESQITEPESNQATYEQWYKTILDGNYELIMGGAETYGYMEGTSGIGEIIMNSEGIEADAIGYAFIDVNQDGVTELIIGSVDEEKEGKYYSENIYAAYTYNDIPYLLKEGWSRNRCYLLDDGTFYSEGSNGAMYKIFENYVLEANATQLVCKDMYFTMEKDESFEEIACYHNTTGEWDASVSEELGEDAFWSQFDAYGSRTISFELVPFSAYQYAGVQKNIEVTEDEILSAEWMTAEQLADSRMQNYVADDSQPQVIVALYAKEEVGNVKVLSLAYEDADEMGNVVFSAEELFHYGDLGPNNPLAITLTMYGTIPYYGVSYETADGETHYYAICESGMDGSAVLMEFEPKLT